jgi:hypothetical protein
MRYRCLIQERGTTDKHVAHISFETDNVKASVKKIKSVLSEKIQERRKLFFEWLQSRQPDMCDKIMKEYEDDLIDWKSKAKDISKKDFLKNEIWMELQ